PAAGGTVRAGRRAGFLVDVSDHDVHFQHLPRDDRLRVLSGLPRTGDQLYDLPPPARARAAGARPPPGAAAVLQAAQAGHHRLASPVVRSATDSTQVVFSYEFRLSRV